MARGFPDSIAVMELSLAKWQESQRGKRPQKGDHRITDWNDNYDNTMNQTTQLVQYSSRADWPSYSGTILSVHKKQKKNITAGYIVEGN